MLAGRRGVFSLFWFLCKDEIRGAGTIKIERIFSFHYLLFDMPLIKWNEIVTRI